MVCLVGQEVGNAPGKQPPLRLPGPCASDTLQAEEPQAGL